MKTFLQRLGKRALTRLVGVVIAVVIVLGYFACQKLNGGKKPEITLNDTKLSTDMTVQDILDKGFQVRASSTSDTNINANAVSVPSNSYVVEHYYIFAENGNDNWEYTNLYFSVYNASSSSIDFAEAKIYVYVYDATGDSSAEVTINGVNFQGMSSEEAVEAFEKAGLKYDSDEKKEFLDGSKSLLYGKPTEYKYILEQDTSSEAVTYVKVEKNIQ